MTKKNHHTVPKKFLESFTDSNGNFWYFDKNSKFKKPARANKKSATTEDFFYNIWDYEENIEKDGIENAIGETVENDYGLILPKVLNKQTLTRNEEQKLIDFIIFQYFRTPQFYKELYNKYENITREELEREYEYLTKVMTPPYPREKLPKIEHIMSFRNIVDERIKKNWLHIAMLMNHSIGLRMFIEKNTFFVFDSNIELITSDNPVIMEKETIKVALSPNCMAFIGEEEYYNEFIDSDSTNHLFLDLNVDVILNSEKYIYAKNKNTLELYIEATSKT